MASPVSVRVEDHDNARWLFAVVGLSLVGALALWAWGLPGTDLHGPLHRAGIMDPFCGGTRATYVLVRGDVAEAWSWNPLVPLLAVAVLAALARALVGWTRHRWLNVRMPRRLAVLGVATTLVAVEVNQQLQADRLVNALPG